MIMNDYNYYASSYYRFEIFNVCFSFSENCLLVLFGISEENDDNMLCGVLRMRMICRPDCSFSEAIFDDDESDQYACMGIHGM